MIHAYLPNYKKRSHYYIDVDNLDSFFGLTSEAGTKKGEKKFDFAAWLKNERKKIIKDKKKKAKSAECTCLSQFIFRFTDLYKVEPKLQRKLFKQIPKPELNYWQKVPSMGI